MIDFFYNLNPVIQTLLASLLTFFITAIGSAMVFLFKSINKDKMDKLLSISAGIMLASTMFSLINPALSYSNNLNLNSWFLCSLGIFSGGLLLYLGDKFYQKTKKTDRMNMVILSITMHNFPEGMAIGVAFGSAIYGMPGATVMGALALALGIGIQNFPEGCAISFPLYRKGYTKLKSFLIGAATAAVEPVGALLGLFLAIKFQFILPFLLSFAAGAMLYVIVVELIPESMTNEKKDQMALLLIIGFIIMMILDISLG
ncbi:MAG: ZIP family metal transporter [Bacilli bacterium]|nr:ZIP family metal transporter [Bacilli bacterium]